MHGCDEAATLGKAHRRREAESATSPRVTRDLSLTPRRARAIWPFGPCGAVEGVFDFAPSAAWLSGPPDFRRPWDPLALRPPIPRGLPFSSAFSSN
jgi:hypothetical protein